MSVTQFAMVEELAFLVKDNLPCKHLVLSMEEAFINFLQDDASSDGILELEPMNSYNRLLLHRLADIFGFAHESIGEGEDRHLVLQRCPETSVPSILVSDILWQCDEPQSLTVSRHILTREGTAPVMETKFPSFELSLQAREAAYLAARERIFTMDIGEIKNLTLLEQGENEDACSKANNNADEHINLVVCEKNVLDETTQKKPTNASIPGRTRSRVNKEFSKEHLGAAKRMFANALGLHSAKDSRGGERKTIQ
ncbi:Detected protein of confused Function [Hibiscus syriacus]|uniref:Detected protein of confused Function n=1 Tax=Hibiscus syriacus TaxID=106335 RepID=A0A6A2ZHQ5_HIBSY|nr:Detected protein of confused Function [Hibiscus syriacus]